MDATNLAGWTVTVLLIAGGLLRWITLWLDDASFGLRFPRASVTAMPQLAKHILTSAGALIGMLGIAGAIWFPHSGLWGPAVLVFSVIWDFNLAWKHRHVQWTAPVEVGLERGSKLVLLGGALGTLIAYVFSIA